MNLRTMVGQLLVTGFDGPELRDRTARALQRGERAGVIVFKRNLPTREATIALCQAVRAAVPAGPPPLIAIDEEGGRVSRLPPGEPRLPPMRVLGSLGDPALVRQAGRALGQHLLALGVNLDFAPVLDVDSNPANPVIGDRSFSSAPGVVAELGVELARGLAEGGVLACGKHFPGHGDTDKDSHFDLPRIAHGRARLDALELVPFRAAARAHMDSLMSAHVVVEALAPGAVATFSPAVMTTLLRTELGFEGALFSDDLEMRAVSAEHGPEESALSAVSAGCDLVLVCKDEDQADRAFEALVREAEKSPAFAERARQAERRSAKLRSTAFEREAAPRVAGPTLAEVVADIERRLQAQP